MVKVNVNCEFSDAKPEFAKNTLTGEGGFFIIYGRNAAPDLRDAARRGDDMKKYGAALFDLDGTLLDTLADLRDAVNFALAGEGRSSRTTAEVRQFVGNGSQKLIDRAAPDADEAEKARLLAAFKARYAGHILDKTVPYPGIVEVLNELKRRGVKCAVVSNKFDAAAKGVCAGCLGDFPAVVIGEGNGIVKKPDPSGCNKALALLGAKKENAVYIGDSDVDSQTARNAGLDCILVSWGFRDRDVLEATGETRICDEPAQLLPYFIEGETL